MRPAKLQEVQNTMDTLLYDVTYSPKLFEPAIAFTTTRSNDLAGDIYKVFVNNADPELADFLYLHECGHIIFAHCKNMDQRMDKFIRAKISSAYQKVSKLFPSEKTFARCFRNLLFNMVMDFEVNSRLFSKSEWKFMQQKIKILMKNPSVKGFWPEDYGFPAGLTWNEYLNLILLDPNEFFTKYRFLKKHAEEACDFNNKQSWTQQEYEAFRKEYAEKKLSEEFLKKMKEDANDHTSSGFGIPTGDDGCSKGYAKPIHIEYETYNDKTELVHAIIKLLRIKKRRPSKRDIMYNENRRKLNTKVIVPKTTQVDKNINANLYILLDVSGSIDVNLVNDFVSTFKEVEANYKNVRFVSWNTQLVSDWKISEVNSHNYGGGTDLAPGIAYVQEKYNPSSKDVFFVISDFYDDLAAWEKSLSNMRCKKYAINWKAYHIISENPGFQDILIYNKKN